LYSTKI